LREFRTWLLAVTLFTIPAASLAFFVRRFDGWLGLAALTGISIIPFTAEALIQFNSWPRRLIWILVGLLNVALILGFYGFRNSFDSPYLQEVPEWIRGPIIFLLPAIFEFATASGARKHAWIWVAITPPLFGLMTYWPIQILNLADKVMALIQPSAITSSPIAQLYDHAVVLGTLFFTRAVAGSLVASRIIR
jgi:hypothetical protein